MISVAELSDVHLLLPQIVVNFTRYFLQSRDDIVSRGNLAGKLSHFHITISIVTVVYGIIYNIDIVQSL